MASRIVTGVIIRIVITETRIEIELRGHKGKLYSDNRDMIRKVDSWCVVGMTVSFDIDPRDNEIIGLR